MKKQFAKLENIDPERVALYEQYDQLSTEIFAKELPDFLQEESFSAVEASIIVELKEQRSEVFSKIMRSVAADRFMKNPRSARNDTKFWRSVGKQCDAEALALAKLPR